MARLSNSRNERLFEEYLRDGISAVKGGQFRLAQSLLNRALIINSADARPYLWLSEATYDVAEKREYLEQAVAAEPGNSSARLALAKLTGKIDQTQLIQEGDSPMDVTPSGKTEVQVSSFSCPQCGGRMTFSIASSQLACEYCGHIQIENINRDVGSKSWLDEKDLSFIMHTHKGHNWAQAQHRFGCQQCGAINILSPGQIVSRCPYCGSHQIIESSEQDDLIDPQVIVLMRLDERQAQKKARDWMGSGLFAPDNMLVATQSLQLRPAYYSCWTFEGTVEICWTCEVVEGSREERSWAVKNGVESRFFSDVLVTGVKALLERDLAVIEPFDLKVAEEFSPEHLAGWTTILYNRPVSDASLLARQKVMKGLRSQIYESVEMGRDKRKLRIGGGNWSGLAYQHVLLPIWIGAFRFQGKNYKIFVNGQSGKVGGDKPRDTVKLIFATLTITMLLFLLLVLFLLFTNSEALF